MVRMKEPVGAAGEVVISSSFAGAVREYLVGLTSLRTCPQGVSLVFLPNPADFIETHATPTLTI
jgi:hypothetical protein